MSAHDSDGFFGDMSEDLARQRALEEEEERRRRQDSDGPELDDLLDGGSGSSGGGGGSDGSGGSGDGGGSDGSGRSGDGCLPDVSCDGCLPDLSFDGCLPDCDGCFDCGGCFDCSLGMVSLAPLMRLAAPRSPRPRRGPTAPGRVGVTAIRGYQRWISPRLPTRCRYTPSCSEYGAQAVRRFGLVAGARMAAARIARCSRDVVRGTHDPVP
jgi:putative membrane protein insertion efficiency factor